MVYQTRHITLERLCEDITRCTQSITQNQLRDAVNHLIDRAELILNHDGEHIEQFL